MKICNLDHNQNNFDDFFLSHNHPALPTCLGKITQRSDVFPLSKSPAILNAKFGQTGSYKVQPSCLNRNVAPMCFINDFCLFLVFTFTKACMRRCLYRLELCNSVATRSSLVVSGLESCLTSQRGRMMAL